MLHLPTPNIGKRLARFMPDWLARRRLHRAAANTVLLTFDDGPHPEITPAVLDRLRAYRARALFFVVGHRIARAPKLLARIVREGHLLGNHTFSHARTQPWRFQTLRDDVVRCQALIEAHAGVRPRWFRPPYGQLSPATMLVPRLLGMRVLTWLVDSADWSCRGPDDAHKAALRLLPRVTARDIILMHDDTPAVLTILDRLLPVLAQRRLNLADGVVHGLPQAG